MSTDANAIQIVVPLQITDAMIIDSGSPPETNVPENDYAQWAGGTTYAEGDRVIILSTHKIYESLQDANTNNNPVSSPTWWIEVGPTNRWAVFDDSNSTQAQQANNITYTLELGSIINTVGILNITGASSVTVTMTDPTAGEVYNNAVELTTYPQSSEWYSWFFGDRTKTNQFVFKDLPAYVNAEIRIQIIGDSTLAVGSLIFGQRRSFGRGIKYGARLGIQDYSRKETNEFGDIVLIERAFARRANFDLFLDSNEVDRLQSILSDIRAKVCLWLISESYESTVIFGFYKNFDILINYPDYADCQLEIEGLT
jgi:hypothetical protein